MLVQFQGQFLMRAQCLANTPGIWLFGRHAVHIVLSVHRGRHLDEAGVCVALNLHVDSHKVICHQYIVSLPFTRN